MPGGSVDTTANRRLFPRTTYEGQAEEDVSSWIQKMNSCQKTSAKKRSDEVLPMWKKQISSILIMKSDFQISKIVNMINMIITDDKHFSFLFWEIFQFRQGVGAFLRSTFVKGRPAEVPLSTETQPQCPANSKSERSWHENTILARSWVGNPTGMNGVFCAVTLHIWSQVLVTCWLCVFFKSFCDSSMLVLSSGCLQDWFFIDPEAVVLQPRSFVCLGQFGKGGFWNGYVS